MLSISGDEHEDVSVRDGIALFYLKLVIFISSPDGLKDGLCLKATFAATNGIVICLYHKD